MRLLSDDRLGALAARRLPVIGTLLARRAAARALHAPALAGAGEDAVVLALLGLHAAAAGGRGRDRAAARARVVAWAALGQAGAADVRGWPQRWRRRLAAALAPHDPVSAADLLADDPAARAACLLAAGFQPAPDPGGSGPEGALIRAALATGRARAEAIDAAFATFGLAAPLADGAGCRLADYRGTAGGPIGTGPLVSVVVPLHQGEDTIAVALDSLSRQRWSRLEILVVDDRSADRGPEVVRSKATADPRIRLLPSVGPPGASGARNTGIAAAAGELVAFLDADDWAHPERIARQMARLRREDAATVSGHYRVDPDGRPVAPRVFPMLRLCPISMLVRRAVLASAGPFEIARTGADAELLGRLDTIWGRRRLPRDRAPLTVALWRPNSLSNDAAHTLADRERTIYREQWMRRHVALFGGLPAARPSF